ncbi:hypothetical protein N0824_00166 [Microcystis sp. 0824]|nr:hypothetical protein N0824_00166 [Microcystis sp. 0824]
MWLLLLHRSIFGERTMHIYCSCDPKSRYNKMSKDEVLDPIFLIPFSE